MAESKKHKEEKRKAAGPKGRTEIPLPGNRRLDASSKDTDTEVELSGDPRLIEKAVKRVVDGPKQKKQLVVPPKDLVKAKKATPPAVRVKSTKK
jgi:hypothetical protein